MKEGIYAIFVNPNIAGTASSKVFTDNVYFRPITQEIIIQY